MQKILEGIKVDHLLAELAEYPELWDRYTFRTQLYESSPHKEVHDIWVRFRDYSDFDEDDPQEFFNNPNADYGQWYATAWMLKGIKQTIENIVTLCDINELGGCLITKIPSRCQVKPHKDLGYHPEYFKDKYLLCLQSNKDQKFCYANEEHIGLPGELFIFDNQAEHWVENNSDEDRISLLIAGRKN
jgi:hypothetical protein